MRRYQSTFPASRFVPPANVSSAYASLCANFVSLQKFGHPKWKEVELTLPELGEGWAYYPATAQEIRKCAPVKVPAKPSCSAQEIVLGLCGPVK